MKKISIPMIILSFIFFLLMLNWLPKQTSFKINQALTIEQVSTPYVSSYGGVEKGTLITIGTATPNASIYYTLDGNIATTSSTLYTEPIPINDNLTLTIFAVASGYTDSQQVAFNYAVLTHRVTYNIGTTQIGSAPYDSNYYAKTDTVTVYGIGNAQKLGYLFSGWSLSSSATTLDYVEGSTFTMDTSNVTLYAVWSINSVILPDTTLTNGTYNSNYYTTVSPSTGSGNYSYELVSGELPTGLGIYNGTNYSLVFNGVIKATGTFTFSIRVTDYWNGTTSTAQFSLTVNTLGVAASATASITPGEVNPNTTIDIYFNGTAYYTLDGTTPTVNSSPYSDAFVITDNLTIKVLVIKEGYDPSEIVTFNYYPVFRITYEMGSYVYGSLPFDTNSYQIGELATLLDASGAYKLGYTLIGWNLASDGSGISYNLLSSYTMTNSNLTLYALWEVDPIQIDDETMTSGTYDSHYDGELVAYGSSSNYDYTILDGLLPEGIAYYIDGYPKKMIFYGIPTEFGTFTFTVKATDNNNNTVDTASITLVIDSLGTLDAPTSSSNTNLETYDNIYLDSTNGANIYYQLNGGAYQYYSGSISIVNNSTVVAYAHKDGYIDSETATFTFVLNEHYVYYDSLTPTHITDSNTYVFTQLYTLKSIGDITMTGYHFTGWNQASDYSGETFLAGAQIYMGPVDVTYYAVWTPDTYKVNYVGSYGLVYLSDTVDYASTYHLAEPQVVNGFIFLGYSLYSDLSGDLYQVGDEITIGLSDITYYVVREILQVAIQETLPDATYNTSYEKTLIATGGTGDYHFWTYNNLPNGITLSSDGMLSGIPLETGTFEINITVQDNVNYSLAYQTLYLRILGLGKTSNPSISDSGYVEADTVIIVSSEANQIIYYTLDGSNPSFTSTLYQNGIVVSHTTTVKIIAYQEGYEPSDIVTETYTIILHSVTYDTLTSDSLYDPNLYKKGEIATILDIGSITQLGYHFVGWYLETDPNTIWIADDTLSIEGDLVLYALWELDEYVLYTYNNQGEVIGTEIIQYGNTLVEPSYESILGYDFIGWYVDFLYTQLYDFDTLITENITLYPKYEIIQYRITFNTVDGETLSDEIYTVVDTVNLPIPTKSGYTFKGWFTTSDYSGDAITELEIGSYGDLSLYALWASNSSIDLSFIIMVISIIVILGVFGLIIMLKLQSKKHKLAESLVLLYDDIVPEKATEVKMIKSLNNQKPFSTRIENASIDNKIKYNELNKLLLSYPNVKRNRCILGDKYRINQTLIGIITLQRNILKLHLNVQKEIMDDTIQITDEKDIKRYTQVPILFKLTSEANQQAAIQAIKELLNTI